MMLCVCVCWRVSLGDAVHQDSGSHFLLQQIRPPTAAAGTPAPASLPLMTDVDRIPTINSEKKRREIAAVIRSVCLLL